MYLKNQCQAKEFFSMVRTSEKSWKSLWIFPSFSSIILDNLEPVTENTDIRCQCALAI